MDRRLFEGGCLLLLLVLVAGCRHPIQANAKTDSRVTMTMPSSRAQQALSTFSVEPGNGRRIAVVDVDGLLLNQPLTGLYSEGENPVAVLHEKLGQIATSPCYSAVVLRINSPGGGVTASDIMWHEIQEFKARCHIPVVACLMDVGTGGAYYLATSADHIVAHPTTITGGIGVIMNLYNLTDAMAQFNIVGTPVKSGPNIDLGTPIAPPTEEGRAILQKMADEFHNRFRQVVIQQRPQLASAAPDIFDGRVFSAQQALGLHLIDSIGYLDQAIEMARELSGSPGAQVVMLHRKLDGARTPYDVTANVPLQSGIIPLSMPGWDRSRLPTFLYLWQPEPTLERLGGR